MMYLWCVYVFKFKKRYVMGKSFYIPLFIGLSVSFSISFMLLDIGFGLIDGLGVNRVFKAFLTGIFDLAFR